MNKIWSDEVENIAFTTPVGKSLSILPSLLNLLIDGTIFVPSHLLVGPLPTRRPFNVTVWFHLVCCSKVLIPKHFLNIQGSGRDLIIGLTSKKMLVKTVNL